MFGRPRSCHYFQVDGRASCVLEATTTELTNESDFWKECSEESLAMNGYQFQEQCGLVASFLSRRIKFCGGSEASAKFVNAFCKEGEADSIKVHPKTQEALYTCLLPLCAPSGFSVEDLEKALEMVNKDEDNEIVQAFLTTQPGRALKKEADLFLAKRKESASVSKRIVELAESATVRLSEASLQPHDRLRVFAQGLIAATTELSASFVRALSRTSHIQDTCIYVYMYICMCICIYIYVHIHTSIHTYIRTYIHAYIHTYILC